MLLDLRVKGLVIRIAPFNGTNPVPARSATLVCNGMPGTPSETFPVNAGNGRLRATVAMPSPCLAPALLVNPAPNGVVNAAVYIAAYG